MSKEKDHQFQETTSVMEGFYRPGCSCGWIGDTYHYYKEAGADGAGALRRAKKSWKKNHYDKLP